MKYQVHTAVFSEQEAVTCVKLRGGAILVKPVLQVWVCAGRFCGIAKQFMLRRKERRGLLRAHTLTSSAWLDQGSKTRARKLQKGGPENRGELGSALEIRFGVILCWKRSEPVCLWFSGYASAWIAELLYPVELNPVELTAKYRHLE